MLSNSEWQKLEEDPFGQLGKTRVQQIRDVQQEVEYILEQDRTARNNDNYLVKKVWERNPNIPVQTITRARRQIQNTQCRLLPTDPRVVRRRRIKEETFRQYYSQEPELILWYENEIYGVK